jgi:hypothetical protein
MALEITETGDQIAVSPSATINSLTACTRLLWIYFDQLNGNSGIYGKGSGPTRRQLVIPGAGGVFTAEERTTTGIFSTSGVFTNFATTIATGKWLCLATQVNLAVNTSGKIFVGDLATSLAEPSSYGVQSGTAAPAADDSASALLLGIDNDGDLVSDCKLAVFGLWNRVLSLAELQSQQPYQNLVVTSGCVCFLNLDPTASAPTATQTDLSGNGNHGTPTGTTSYTHPALSTFSGAVVTTGGVGEPLLTTRLQAPSRGGILY